jgi:hypothetical protein
VDVVVMHGVLFCVGNDELIRRRGCDKKYYDLLTKATLDWKTRKEKLEKYIIV